MLRSLFVFVFLPLFVHLTSSMTPFDSELEGLSWPCRGSKSCPGQAGSWRAGAREAAPKVCNLSNSLPNRSDNF